MKTSKYFQTFSDVLTPEEHATCLGHLRQRKWSFDNSSEMHPERGILCWSLWGLEETPFFSAHFLARITALTGKRFDVEKIYANGQTFGLDGVFHHDGPEEGDRRITFLYYPTLPKSDAAVYEFGGETQFIQDDGAIHHVYPFPNTAVAFAANILHRGMSPSRFSTELRMSVAFKLIEK